MSIGKKELIKQFQKNPDRYWRVKLFDDLGFRRKQCVKCGKFFWTLTEQTICNDSSCRPYDFIGNPPTKIPLDYFETWKAIEKFFVKNGHTPLKPYPTVCRWFDLFFTIAGIVNFYRHINGELDFEFPTNPSILVQPCLRFNDVVNTGVNGRSYTCFGMVQQSSLYDGKQGYWKDRCIELDFELLTKVFGIKPEEIVFIEDAWLGPSAFGSSLEYHVQGLELGNAVFTEFVGTPDNYREMDKKIIDMGAGWERLTWITQGTPTSYDCVFGPVIEKLKKETNIEYDKEFFLKYSKLSGILNFDELSDIKTARMGIAKKLGVSLEELERSVVPLEALYSIADHSRTLVFALSDAGIPSNVAGGYNLRVILRRALNFIEKFKWKVNLQDVATWHIDYLKKMFPNLAEHKEEIINILDVEERRYRETKERTKKIVDRIVADGKAVDEETMIKLYDSDGVTPELLAEAGLDVKTPADFYVKITERHMSQKKEEEQRPFDLSGIPKTKILFYEEPEILEFNAKIIKIFEGNKVVLDQTSFYATSGGQMFDAGTIAGIEVVDVNKYGDVVVHTLKSVDGIKVGDSVSCEVDKNRRQILKQHHTGNHIINLSARSILGSHVWQHSALKDVDKAKIEITHYDALTDEETKKIEDYANAVVKKSIPVKIELMPRGEAEQKYGFRIYQGSQGVPSREVRIISIGDLDHAACGGTHCDSTGEVGFITILRTKRVQDGIVRLEYVCGDVALKQLEEKEKLLKETADALDVKEADVPKAVKQLFEEWKEKRKLVKKMQKKS